MPDGFTLDPEEQLYQAQHALALEQMAWRRAKIVELKGEALFMQEYPATPDEAFAVSSDASFIASGTVRAARQARAEPSGPLLIGVDPGALRRGPHRDHPPARPLRLRPRADELLADGDMEGQREWLLIRRAIEELQRKERRV